jgi:hypothetical protein
MILTGSVAGFTGDAFTFMRKRELPMRIVGKLLYGIGVASLTNF